MSWRVAKSLLKLRDQINTLYPNRDKSNDGTIGDESHASRASDHNPNEHGVVTAMDITHDPDNGVDAGDLAETLVASRDHRIKYIISNRRISNPDIDDWEWRHYAGSNPHTAHVHISVKNDPELYDDESTWEDTPALPPAEPKIIMRGKGSWFSQYEGKYSWVDRGDEPNSNKLRVPDDEQGIALYSDKTLGKWFDVTAPNGVTLRLQQTDKGPNPKTGRLIDIAAVAAERFGYTPRNFPTDEIFSWSPAEEPMAEPTQTTPTLDITTLIKEIAALSERLANLAVLLGKLQQAIPAPGATPPVVIAPPPVTEPVIQKPSVQLSAAGLGASLLAMATGILGTPFGMGAAPTDNGTLATIIPIVTGLVGMTGGWGAVASIALKALGAFGGAVAAKSK